MIISESWLREWVSPDLTTDALAELLTQAGLEVETITHQTLLGDKVVVGQIVSIDKHPDADKLNVCQVDVGDKALLTIVCGANNARKGLVAPIALVGAVLPSGMEISAREVRGIASSGMICAASELGLEAQSRGLLELDTSATIGTKIDDYLSLNDAIIDVDLTPDRGDCLSIAGVAKDVAALSKASLTELAVEPVLPMIDDKRRVNLSAVKECPRYVGRIIKNINKNTQTTDIIKEKLRRSGVRCISPVVDITNYVMLELGQPMHAFDLNKIQGDITVRMATQGESLVLLDEQKIALKADMLVIADEKKPVALAGIMGGANSEVDDSTTDILLEAAYFSPLVIAGKARTLGLHTDASHRFERGVDSQLQLKAIERATALLLEIVGGECGPVFDAVSYENMPAIETISLRPERVRTMLGLDVDNDTIKQHLLDLQMTVEGVEAPWQVTRPSWRFDVTGEHDLVEEIGRLEGLDKIKPNFPILRARPYTEPEKAISPYLLSTWLASQEYREVVSYSFIAPEDQLPALINGENAKAVDLANPIASNMAQMRLSILPGLLNTARSNEQRQHDRIRLFEMGHVFSVDPNSDTGATEQSKLALIAGGESSSFFWSGHDRPVNFYDVKGVLDNLFDRIGVSSLLEYQASEALPFLHPGRSAKILLDNEMIGYIGALHPQSQKHFDLKQTYIVAEITLSSFLSRTITEFEGISKFPVSHRDLALVLKNEISADDILKEIQEIFGKLLKNCELFDIYRGENIKQGYKSLAFSLSLQSKTQSLESEAVDEMINELLGSLKSKYGVTLRS